MRTVVVTQAEGDLTATRRIGPTVLPWTEEVFSIIGPLESFCTHCRPTLEDSDHHLENPRSCDRRMAEARVQQSRALYGSRSLCTPLPQGGCTDLRRDMHTQALRNAGVSSQPCYRQSYDLSLVASSSEYEGHAEDVRAGV